MASVQKRVVLMMEEMTPFDFGPEGGWEQVCAAPFSGTIFLLHGLGADCQDLAGILPYLGLSGEGSFRFLLPNAPIRSIKVNQGMKMRAWYDVSSPRIELNPDWDGMNRSADQLLKWVSREKENGVPLNKIFLAGFSQGGLVCLQAGLRSREEFGGILALSTYDPEPDFIADRWTGKNHQKIFMAHGTRDPVVPYDLGEKSFRGFVRLGWEGEWYSHSEGHTLTLEEIEAIRRWLVSAACT
ncbi:phospholipase/carboxylesterase family protein [Leptospirillum ferriphilum]|uniref:Phospholipase/carboxylesterase family protein n=3 Tax=Leptospirillum TaxID=179 RepID=A0A094WAY2_9BACT|nr:phospholipase/carboxylesterase family protein [Leptospirillum ferriphilum]